jgi:hypothetical protein
MSLLEREASPMVHINKRYKKIRRELFPAWDKKGEWTLKVSDNEPFHGQVFPENKQIVVVKGWCKDLDTTDRLLIHEICHVVTPGNHNKRWIARMEKAAQRASELGRSKLAKLIMEDVKGYTEAIREYGFGSKAPYMYSSIVDAVHDYYYTEKNILTKDQVITWVANDNGFHAKEFEEKYTCCEEIYWKAVKSLANLMIPEARFKRRFGKTDHERLE